MLQTHRRHIHSETKTRSYIRTRRRKYCSFPLRLRLLNHTWKAPMPPCFPTAVHYFHVALESLLWGLEYTQTTCTFVTVPHSMFAPSIRLYYCHMQLPLFRRPDVSSCDKHAISRRRARTLQTNVTLSCVPMGGATDDRSRAQTTPPPPTLVEGVLHNCRTMQCTLWP